MNAKTKNRVWVMALMVAIAGCITIAVEAISIFDVKDIVAKAVIVMGGFTGGAFITFVFDHVWHQFHKH